MSMNLFDASAGVTDGTQNGNSVEIVGSGGPVDIFVSGVFDGAAVTLQRFSKVKSAFMPTGAVWTDSDEFQGLIVRPGEKYRLQLSNAGAGTSLIAESR